MLHQRIHAIEDVEAAVLKALPVVAKLAVERAKKWPRHIHARSAHRERIGSLESELQRVAGNLDDVSANQLEQLGRAELKRRGRSVPAIAPDIGERNGDVIRAEGEYLMVRDILDAEEAKLARVQERIAKVRADLRNKEASLVALGGEVPARAIAAKRGRRFTGRACA